LLIGIIASSSKTLSIDSDVGILIAVPKHIEQGALQTGFVPPNSGRSSTVKHLLHLYCSFSMIAPDHWRHA
jgi:hypothetical protein